MDERKKQTYCLKPIDEAAGCKEFCHQNFRGPCLERFEKYTNGDLLNTLTQEREEEKGTTD